MHKRKEGKGYLLQGSQDEWVVNVLPVTGHYGWADVRRAPVVISL